MYIALRSITPSRGPTAHPPLPFSNPDEEQKNKKMGGMRNGQVAAMLRDGRHTIPAKVGTLGWNGRRAPRLVPTDTLQHMAPRLALFACASLATAARKDGWAYYPQRPIGVEWKNHTVQGRTQPGQLNRPASLDAESAVRLAHVCWQGCPPYACAHSRTNSSGYVVHGQSLAAVKERAAGQCDAADVCSCARIHLVLSAKRCVLSLHGSVSARRVRVWRFEAAQHPPPPNRLTGRRQ